MATTAKATRLRVQPEPELIDPSRMVFARPHKGDATTLDLVHVADNRHDAELIIKGIDLGLELNGKILDADHCEFITGDEALRAFGKGGDE